MIVNIKNKETNVGYLQVDAGVRYYEDTVVNGADDISLYDSKGDGEPFVPCVVKIKDKPTSCIYSDHYRWKPLIDVSNGQIVNWRKGTTADVHYKVCDDGVYCLLNNNKQQIIRIESYLTKKPIYCVRATLMASGMRLSTLKVGLTLKKMWAT